MDVFAKIGQRQITVYSSTIVSSREYLLWKYEVLKNFILSEPRFYKKNNSLTIRTISHSELTALRLIFYRQNKKIIPTIIEEFLDDPLILAVWFMDDGNIRKRNGSLNSYDLNTQSFSLEENKEVAKAMQNVHGIRFTINLNNGYYRLHLSVKDTLKFRDLIKPFVVESMRYKLG